MLPATESFAATCASEDGGAPLNGQCSTLPNKFTQTIKQIRLMKLNNDNSITFVDMGGSPQSYDFASVSAGSALGDFIGAQIPPDGTYVGISPVIDPMAAINAEVTVDGMYCRTTSTGFSSMAGTPADYTYDFTVGSPFSSSNDASYDYSTAGSEEEWLNGSGDVVIAKKFSSPIVVNAANPPDVSINIAFDAAEAADFSFNGAECTGALLGALQATFTTVTN
jgi:hypothetical protein